MRHLILFCLLTSTAFGQSIVVSSGRQSIVFSSPDARAEVQEKPDIIVESGGQKVRLTPTENPRRFSFSAKALPENPVPVAKTGPAASLPVRLKWNVKGNWNPTQAETAAHLRDDHGVSTAGLTHQQMHDLHADLHEGRRTSAVAIKSKPSVITNRGSACPGGVCPTYSRPVRRGVFGLKRRR